MKHNHNHDNARSPGPLLVPVLFKFNHPTARSVCLAGTFNNWKADSRAMHHGPHGEWTNEVLLAPGMYEYCLVVDGNWMPDPSALESIPNPYGGTNSVLKVSRSPEALHLDDAENLPLTEPKT